MALSDDPLYQKQTDLASRLLGLYDPDAEEQRRQKALGQMQDVIGTRYARAGETGSSVEKDALSNAAKDFSLGWAERQPQQYREAISGSQLPISNLLTGSAQDIAAGGLTGYYGGAPTLARQTANENFNLNQEKLQWLKDQATQNTWSNFLGSVGQKSGVLDWLFPGSGTGFGGGGTGAGGLGGAVGGAPSLINWLTGAKSLPDAWTKLFGGGDVTSGWPSTPEWSPGISPDWSGGQDLSGIWDTWGNTPEFQPGDLSWLFPDASGPAAGAGAGGAAAGAGLAGGNVGAGLTPAAVEAMTGLSTGAGAGAGAAGAEGAGALAGMSAAGPFTAALALLGWLTNPQASPIPAMRDKTDQFFAEQTKAKAQELLRYTPAQLEELVQQAAKGSVPDFISRGVDALPSQYDVFKRRFWQAVQHQGEFAGMPGQPGVPTAAEQNAQAQVPPELAALGVKAQDLWPVSVGGSFVDTGR